MIAPLTVPRHIGPAWVRDETLRSALRATEELATMLQAPASHLTPERVETAQEMHRHVGAYLNQLHEAVERVALCERQATWEPNTVTCDRCKRTVAFEQQPFTYQFPDGWHYVGTNFHSEDHETVHEVICGDCVTDEDDANPLNVCVSVVESTALAARNVRWIPPDYTDETRRAAQEAIDQREAMREMVNSIGPAGWEFWWERS